MITKKGVREMLVSNIGQERLRINEEDIVYVAHILDSYIKQLIGAGTPVGLVRKGSIYRGKELAFRYEWNDKKLVMTTREGERNEFS